MDTGYSQFVRWAKVILPLVALSLLATLFLFAERTSGPEGFPLARLDELVRDPKLTEPRFSGMFGDRSSIEVSARSVRPSAEPAWDMEVEGISLAVTADENRMTVVGGLALISGQRQKLDVRGLSRLSVNDQYSIETLGLSFDLPKGTLTSTERLEARTPFGALEAGKMHVSVDTDQQSFRLEFTGGVELVYTP